MRLAIRRTQILAGLILLALEFQQVALGASKTPPQRQLVWQPSKLLQGSPVLFQLQAPATTQAVSAVWLGHEIVFSSATRRATSAMWYGLAGVPAETVPGTYDLLITQTRSQGKPIEIRAKIKIARALFPKVTVKVPKQYTEPSPEQLSEISADRDLKQKIFATQSTQQQWAGAFVAPASAPISGVFGTQRIFNGAVQSRHLGLDFAVPAGTEVRTVNHGTVILARKLFFEGGCVVVDHGLGLLSLYLHLSEISVKEGEEVASGQVLGLSGGTGRASGPHLHLAIRWQGVYLNPAILMKLKVPGD